MPTHDFYILETFTQLQRNYGIPVFQLFETAPIFLKAVISMYKFV